MALDEHHMEVVRAENCGEDGGNTLRDLGILPETELWNEIWDEKKIDAFLQDYDPPGDPGPSNAAAPQGSWDDELKRRHELPLDAVLKEIGYSDKMPNEEQLLLIAEVHGAAKSWFSGKLREPARIHVSGAGERSQDPSKNQKNLESSWRKKKSN